MTREEAVQELFLNFKDLTELFSEHKLEAFATADVVERLAVSAFMQTHPKNNAPAPTSISADGWIKGKVKQKETKKTSKGADYALFTVNGMKYSAFDRKVFGGKIYNEGDEIEMRVEQDAKGYWNIKEVRGAEIPF